MQRKIATYSGLLILMLVNWFCPVVYAKPLPVEKAFQLSVTIVRPHVVLVTWSIAPGYQLYADRTKVTFSPPTKAAFTLPAGEVKYDAEHEQHRVYTGNLSVPITLPADDMSTTISVAYQ